MGGQTIRPGEAWIARTDGDAHLQPRSGRGRAVCGEPAIDPRFHTPGRPRCVACLDRAGIVVAAPPVPDPPATETEQRAMWGDR